MAKIIEIENVSSVSQSWICDGQQYSLAANEAQVFEERIALAALDQLSGSIQEVPDLVNTTDTSGSETKFVWVANMTGDPLQPATIRIPTHFSRQNGGWQYDNVENPLHVSRTLKREYSRGMQEYTTKNGVYAKNLAPIPITVPPFKRVLLEADIARWFLRRDGQGGIGNRAKAIISRPKSDTEPNVTWSLNKIVSWVNFMEPTRGKLLKTEEECKDEKELRKAKTEALKHAFFICADPRYALPSAERVEQITSGDFSSREEDSEEDIAALMEA